MTPEQQDALAPLLGELARLQELFSFYGDEGDPHMDPAVYLGVAQWRRILEAFVVQEADQRQRRYDEMTLKAGANPQTHSCPHGAACDIHG